MQERRIFLAVLLSFLVIFLFNIFYKSPSTTLDKNKPNYLKNKNLQNLFVIPQDSTFLELSNKNLILRISSEYGFIKEAYLKPYGETPVFKNILLFPKGLKSIDIKKINSQTAEVIFKEGKIRYSLGEDFIINVEIYGKLPQKILLFSKYPEPERFDQRFSEFFYSKNGKFKRINTASLNKKRKVSADWLGVRNRYFCIILQGPFNSVSFRKAKQRVDFITNVENLQRINMRIFIGPQLRSLLEPYGWEEIVYYGVFGGISNIILKILKLFYNLFHNWGISIICLTLLIYIILFPFTMVSTRSMVRMQELQPQIEELRRRYADNPQKLHKETMELYKKYGINPLGGCLPLFFQIPVFIGLYQGLLRSLELKGAKFLWIKDLSLPDRTFKLGFSLPILGNYINILPLIMAFIMFFQQKLISPQTQGSEQQKMFNVFFPILFGVIFYNFPSGLVLYWLTHTLLTSIYQYRLKHTRADSGKFSRENFPEF